MSHDTICNLGLAVGVWILIVLSAGPPLTEFFESLVSERSTTMPPIAPILKDAAPTDPTTPPAPASLDAVDTALADVRAKQAQVDADVAAQATTAANLIAAQQADAAARAQLTSDNQALVASIQSFEALIDHSFGPGSPTTGSPAPAARR